MATARVNLGGAGTSALAALGISGTPSINSTEEWTVPETVTNLVMSD
jgi:hypothetical protein